MDSWDSATLPRFVIVRPAKLRGTVLALGAGRLVLGRGASCDLRLEDSHVSAVHAELSCSPTRTTVRDLGSTNGTLVNGARIAAAQALRHGDVLRFGTVEARFEEPDVAAAPTARIPEVGSLDLEAGIAAALRAAPAGRHARPDTPGQPAAPRSDLDDGRYDHVVRQIIVGQADRLNKVAAAGSRARRLAAIGFVMFALGMGIVTGLLVRPAAHSAPSLLGTAVHGIPIGAVGFAAGLIGIIIMIAGIVPHLTATSTRRCLDPYAQPAAVSSQDWPAEPPPPAQTQVSAEPPPPAQTQTPARPQVPAQAQVPGPAQGAGQPQVHGQAPAAGKAEPVAVERPALPRRQGVGRQVLRRRVATVLEDAWSS